MPPSQVQPPPSAAATPWGARLSLLLIAFAIAVAYAGSLRAPFIFDDNGAIVDNPSIRHLDAWPDVLWAPPSATGAAGRPVINLSLALNYAMGGLNPVGYHGFNLLVHVLAALTLFGLVRRTLRRPVLRDRFERHATPLALACALLWGLHPLLTESVTFVIQRTESLSGLIYLFSLYALNRSFDDGGRRRWLAASVGACLVGMATKETTVTLPVILFLYDRTFGAGSFRAAWRERRGGYLALAATWVPLALLVAANHNRAGIVGFGLGMSPWDYALTQCRAIVLYLRLAVWPHPLIVDYGAEVVSGLAAVWWQALGLIALAAATFWALARRPVIGFLAFAFFGLLAPSSSFVPLTTQTIAEHRMYLPLAALVVLAVGCAYRRWPRGTVPAALGLAALAAGGTIARNADYRTVEGLWRITVADFPANARARVNYGGFLAQDGRFDDAIAQFQEALKLKPHFADAEFNYGNALSQKGDFAAAIPHYKRALASRPNYAQAHYWLAYALMRCNRLDEALTHAATAIRLAPGQPVTLHSYASMLTYAGRLDEALQYYEQVLKLQPDDAALHHEVGVLLVRLGRPDEALAHLQRAVALAPGQVPIRYALAMLLMKLERPAEAASQFAAVVRAEPRFVEARYGLAQAALAQRHWDEAIEALTTVLQLQPGFGEARADLERARLERDLRGSK